MAWNARKTQILKELVQERIQIENSVSLTLKYQLPRTVLQVIGSHCDDATRQAILNDLIDDKVAMLLVDRAEKQAQDANLGDIVTDLNTNKE